LNEARLLWEIGPRGSDVRALRARLGFDAGYLSRLLRVLERDGLVTMATSPADGRVRRATVTARGRAELEELGRRADAQAGALLAPLDDDQRNQLVAAMVLVDRLLRLAEIEVAVADPAGADARRVIAAFVAELDGRLEHGFDPARSRPVDPADLRPPRGAFLLATLHGQPVGCGSVRLVGDGTAEIRRMWTAPETRGLGLGRRLLAALERWATETGATAARLETNRALVQAIALYRSAGYREVAPFNDEAHAHHWFEKRLG
jgi:DNA-binding MarR family transcriptional regulator/GNAT superfamily N-acetyltransferase